MNISVKEIWYYLIGGGSHINLAGKILLSPLILLSCIVMSMAILFFNILEFLFTKKEPEVEHDWWVTSTTRLRGCIVLTCKKTGEKSFVSHPSEEEYEKALRSDSRPYKWEDDSRVSTK